MTVTRISRKITPVRCWAKGLRGTSILVTPLLDGVQTDGLDVGFIWMWLINHDDGHWWPISRWLLHPQLEDVSQHEYTWCILILSIPVKYMGHLPHKECPVAAGLMKLRRSLFDIASQVRCPGLTVYREMERQMSNTKLNKNHFGEVPQSNSHHSIYPIYI